MAIPDLPWNMRAAMKNNTGSAKILAASNFDSSPHCNNKKRRQLPAFFISIYGKKTNVSFDLIPQLV
jgi:hypothetical protein